ncbi:MAG: DUF423 domain-containing protein [Henriciella sp.]|nr:DUF423 domain-containing protein [Hyphomonadaceae bacterium]OUX95713.1 MAG: DUF423 domain-containing protein [Hyphomonas sp. TMED17]CAI8331214.1 MAG: Uncharacterised protein [Hyphomonas sp. TMED17]
MLQFFASLGGFLSVALGAFGAHGLKNLERYQGTLPTDVQNWWSTATLYLIVHSALALAISLSSTDSILRTGALIMIIGAAVFASTLYAMSLGAPSWFGAITPLGGLGMLIGWGLIIWAGLKS